MEKIKKAAKKVRIAHDALSFAIEASRRTHPNEFIGLMREEAGIITSILIIPGSISSRNFSQYNPFQAPLISNSCGVIHSHPNKSNRPSRADLNLFTKSGSIHAIIAYPYNENAVQFYNGKGERIGFEIV